MISNSWQQQGLALTAVQVYLRYWYLECRVRLLTSTCESPLLEQSLNFAHKACTEQREVAAIAMASDIAEMATVPEPVPRSPNIEPNNNDRLDAPCMHEVMLSYWPCSEIHILIYPSICAKFENVQDADSEESKRCRICFEPASEVEGEQSGELISPCACKGTQQYVHKSCLARWQEVIVRVRVRVRMGLRSCF